MSVLYSEVAPASGNSLSKAFNSWFWLARSKGKANSVPLLSYLLRITGVAQDGNAVISAISTPVPIRASSSLRLISQYPWRTQPELHLMILRMNSNTVYQVHQPRVHPLEIIANGLPDVEEFMDCLFTGDEPHAPPWLENIHSFPGILNGLLTPSFYQGHISKDRTTQIFTPQLLGSPGRQLQSKREVTPLSEAQAHFLFTQDPLPMIKEVSPAAANKNSSFLKLGVAPHPGACSIFMWDGEMLMITRDANNDIVMLASHDLLLRLNWFTGQCSPSGIFTKPEYWDPAGLKRQTNSLPSGDTD